MKKFIKDVFAMKRALFMSRKFWLSMVPIVAIILRECGYAISEEAIIGVITAMGILIASIAVEDVAYKLSSKE